MGSEGLMRPVSSLQSLRRQLPSYVVTTRRWSAREAAHWKCSRRNPVIPVGDEFVKVDSTPIAPDAHSWPPVNHTRRICEGRAAHLGLSRLVGTDWLGALSGTTGTYMRVQPADRTRTGVGPNGRAACHRNNGASVPVQERTLQTPRADTRHVAGQRTRVPRSMQSCGHG